MKSKKIISLLLSFCLVFSFAPIAALAEDASGFPHHLGDVDNDGSAKMCKIKNT